MAGSRQSWLFVLVALVTPSSAVAHVPVSDGGMPVPSPRPRALFEPAQSAFEAHETFARESFRISAVNTGEFVDVEIREGRVSEEATKALTRLFRCLRTQTEHDVSPRLVAVLTELARTSGHDLELVSGYRAPLYAHDHSFHVRGEAADIRIVGMTTPEAKALAHAQAVPGVGYYPVSKMIHVDVRDVRYRWTDWTGPTSLTRRK